MGARPAAVWKELPRAWPAARPVVLRAGADGRRGSVRTSSPRLLCATRQVRDALMARPAGTLLVSWSARRRSTVAPTARLAGWLLRSASSSKSRAARARLSGSRPPSCVTTIADRRDIVHCRNVPQLVQAARAAALLRARPPSARQPKFRDAGMPVVVWRGGAAARRGPDVAERLRRRLHEPRGDAGAERRRAGCAGMRVTNCYHTYFHLICTHVCVYDRFPLYLFRHPIRVSRV